MVYHKRCVEAQKVIVKYFRGWQVRKLYRAKFRAIAGPKIVDFLLKSLVSSTVIDFSAAFLCDVMGGF